MIPNIVTDDQAAAGLVACGYALTPKVMRMVLEAAHPDNRAIVRDATLRRLHKDPNFTIVAYGSGHKAFAIPEDAGLLHTYRVELRQGAWRVWAQIVHPRRQQRRWIRVDRTDLLMPVERVLE